MSKISETVFSVKTGDGDQQGVNAPVAWLENIRPIVFLSVTDPAFQLGALHAINLEASQKFLPYLLKLTCLVSGYDESSFTISDFLRYIDGRKIAKPGVGIFANDGVQISDSVQSTLAETLTSFFRSVLNRQEMAEQHQLFVIETPQRFREHIDELNDDFLTHFGGKSVGEPRLLMTKGSEILVAGTHRPCKDRPLPPPVRWSATGQIDGIRGKLHTVFVSVTERKIIPIRFDEEQHQGQLRERVLDQLCYKFEIETEWISTQKSVDRLIAFKIDEEESMERQLI